MNDHDRLELEELRALRARQRRIRREVSKFAKSINDHRNISRKEATSPTIKELKSEWMIVIEALRYSAIHGAIHENIAALLAETLAAILDCRLPEEFQRTNVRPKNDYARPEWRAAARTYASACRVYLIDDGKYKSTIENSFKITRPTVKRWLGSPVEQQFADLLLTEALHVYRQSVAALNDTQERFDQVTDGMGVAQQHERSFPEGMSPDEIRDKMQTAAAAYAVRRRGNIK